MSRVDEPGPRYARILWSLLLGGLAIRLAMAAVHGEGFDLSNLRRAIDAFRQDGLTFYSSINGGQVATYPYPPLYLVWAFIADATGSGFLFVARCAPIAADLAIAWIVQRTLLADSASQQTALCGAALVALGPQVLFTSSVEGQLDSVAILPALVATLLWRRGIGRRALVAGLLIGLGAALKTVPLLMVLALVPTARSRTEAAALIAFAVAVPVLVLAPFMVADPAGVLMTLRYHGYPGGGGLSVILQPSLADFSGEPVGGTVELLQHLNAPLVLLTAIVLGGWLWRHRIEPVRAAAILWLGVFLVGVNWYVQYLNWGLPFFLISGWIVWVAILQAVLLPYGVRYLAGDRGPLDGLDDAVRADSLVAAAVVAWLMWAERLWREIRRRTPGSARA